MASWGRMLEVLDAVPAINDACVTERGRSAPLRGAIEFRHLTFTYPGSTVAVVSNVSIRIGAGTTTAFIGATGSGKSTLLSLLPRLHEPPPGTVFIDDVDVREIPLDRLRGAIGFVPQEPFLFSDSIAENIRFSERTHGPTDPRTYGPTDPASAAAAIARLDTDVEEFPTGYDTVIGERGITLSGGQKQRTAIARAVFADPRILILDDALSAVDTHTEDEILGRLRGVMSRRTSLIIAHRVSTVRQADQIVVLDGGRVVETGRHDELVALAGIYASLYRKQLLEEELDAS